MKNYDGNGTGDHPEAIRTQSVFHPETVIPKERCHLDDSSHMLPVYHLRATFMSEK